MVLVLLLNDSTMLRHNGFIDLGILPEDGCPKGPGKDGWSDRGRRKDRGRRWGQDLGPDGPHRKYRSSSAFSLFPKAPPASRMEPAPASMLSDCRERRSHGKRHNKEERTRASGWAVGPAATYRVGAEASGLQDPHTPGAEPSPNRQRRACHCLRRSSARVAGVAASLQAR